MAWCHWEKWLPSMESLVSRSSRWNGLRYERAVNAGRVMTRVEMRRFVLDEHRFLGVAQRRVVSASRGEAARRWWRGEVRWQAGDAVQACRGVLVEPRNRLDERL